MSDTKLSRRSILKGGAALLAAIPVMAVSTRAFATQNAGSRGALKYQDKAGPKGETCATCGSFKAPNGCQMIPNDNEIKSTGYCVGYNKKK